MDSVDNRGAERYCRGPWSCVFVLNGCLVVQLLLLVLGGLAGVPLSLYLCSAFEDGVIGRGTYNKGQEGENTAK